MLPGRRLFSAAWVGSGEAFAGLRVYSGSLDTRKLGVLTLAALYMVTTGDELGLSLWRDASLLEGHLASRLAVEPLGVYGAGRVEPEINSVHYGEKRAHDYLGAACPADHENRLPFERRGARPDTTPRDTGESWLLCKNDLLEGRFYCLTV